MAKIKQSTVSSLSSIITESERRLILTSWILSDGQSHLGITSQGENPNLPHYILFRDEVMRILYDSNVISKTTIKEMETVTGHHISAIKKYMALELTNSRYKSAPDQSDLGYTYGKIKANIMHKFANDQDAQNSIMHKIDRLFSLQYKIYGFASQNRFHKLASQTYFGWTELLHKNKVSGFDGSKELSSLSILLGFTDHLITDTLTKLESGVITKQKSTTIESYIEKLYRNCGLSDIAASRLKQQLELMAEPFITSIKAVEDNEPTIEVEIDRLRQLFPSNQKLDLIQDIVGLLGISNVEQSKISTLLFKDEKYLLGEFLLKSPSDPKITKRPTISTLNWMKINVLASDFEIFSDKISHIDNKLEALIKEQIIKRIDKWIRSNPYDIDYFTPNTFGFKILYGPDVDDMTFDLMNYIWNAFAVYTDNPKIKFENIKDIIEADTGLLSLLNKEDKGTLIGEPTLDAVRIKLEEAISQETDISKINIYRNTILAVDTYSTIIAEKRKVESVTKRPTHKSLRRIFSSDQYVRSYLMMNLLSRDLGFDPLFFDFLGEELFDKDSATGMYQLHHKTKARSWSIYIRDLMITNIRYHKLYDSIHISDTDTEVLLTGLNMLIELGTDRYKKDSSNWKITEKDIEAVFARLGGGSLYTLSDGRTVLDWWKDGSSIASKVKARRTFSQRLVELNDRIQSLVDHNQDFEAWINEFYPTNGPDWISKGKIQLDSYMWMAEKLKHLRYYVHLEDIDFLKNTWSI